MKPISTSVTGVGTSSWIPTNIHVNPFNIGLGCVVSGTATYTVEHTFEDPAGAVTAFAHESLAAKTASDDGNYAFPVRAIRLNVTAGSGTVTLTVIQAGIGG